MKRQPIQVKDSFPNPSNLYAVDLAIWLWTILFKGEVCHPYHVGSDRKITIADLEHTAANTISGRALAPVSARSTNSASPSYVPSTLRIMSELEIELPINLVQAIIKTHNYYKAGI
jgi:dTDP-glucose 4,6-dehydratase